MTDLPATVFVLYGATGDLAKRMVLPAFFDLYARGLLPRRWKLVGNGRGDVAHEDFRGHVHEVLTEFGGGQFSSFKNALVELCVAKLAPIASEMKRLVADPGHVDSILIDGADRAQAIAAETMKAAKDIVGFIRPR